MGATGLVGVMALVGLVGSGEPAKPTVGFRLQDHRGAWHTLDEARDRKVVVLAFLGAECPLAEAYAPRLAEVARDFEKRGVGFFGVDANQQDGPVAIGRFAEKHGLPFPILKDVGNGLADRLGAERTPEVFVLDGSRAVVYRGRVDDQYAIGIHRPSPTRHDLVDALEAVLAGRPVATPRTDAVGCKIGRATKSAEGGAVTYAREVSRILQSHCVACHRPGEIAPFSLTDYRQAAGWSSMIAEVVDEGRMPPWHASPEHGKFANDARLSADEKTGDPRLGRRRLARGRPGRPAPAGPIRRGVADPPARPRPGDAPRGRDPGRGVDALRARRDRPEADARRLGPGLAGPAGEPGGRPPRRRLRPAARRREDRRGRRRLPRRLRPRDAAPRPARRRGEAHPGRVEDRPPAPLHPPGDEAGRPEPDRPRLRRPGGGPQGTDVGHGASTSASRSRPGRATTSRGPISGSRGPRCSSR